MSMNIKIKSNIGEFETVQTTTQITYMLLTDIKGGIKYKNGLEALCAIKQYRTFIELSKFDFKKEHIEKLDKFIKESNLEDLFIYSI